MTSITISVEQPDDGLYGPDEYWIKVVGPDPLPDFPTIRRMVSEQHGISLPVKPFRYFPAFGPKATPYEEVWVCKKEKVDA